MDAKSKDTLDPDRVDADDAPELTDAFFDGAEVWSGEKFEGMLREQQPRVPDAATPRSPGRPKTGVAKQLVSVRLDQDVVAKLREGGPGWQSRINGVLRQALLTDEPLTETEAAIQEFIDREVAHLATDGKRRA